MKKNWSLQGYTYFLIQNRFYGYSLEPPRRGGSNEYQQSFLSKSIKNINIFSNENFQFLLV